MIAFVPVATHALYVPFDSAFVYLGYLPDFYIIPETDDGSSNKRSFFSLGRLFLPLHRSFGVGARKPRFIKDSYSSYMDYMGTRYPLNAVHCLNISHSVRCLFSSRLPINQSEMEKIVILEKLCEQVDNFSSKDSSLDDPSFGDFLIGGANKSWGKYMCLTPRDQKDILKYISGHCHFEITSFSMMPIASFYKSSIEPNSADLQKESFWLARLSLRSYVSLGNTYRH